MHGFVTTTALSADCCVVCAPQKRDYLQNRKATSFLYLSRLAALKEFAFMKVHTRRLS
jgi:hypothetical protein